MAGSSLGGSARSTRIFPIVYMTGGHSEGWKSQGVPNSILIEKPFAPAQLVTAISQLLNAGSTPV